MCPFAVSLRWLLYRSHDDKRMQRCRRISGGSRSLLVLFWTVQSGPDVPLASPALVPFFVYWCMMEGKPFFVVEMTQPINAVFHHYLPFVLLLLDVRFQQYLFPSLSTVPLTYFLCRGQMTFSCLHLTHFLSITRSLFPFLLVSLMRNMVLICVSLFSCGNKVISEQRLYLSLGCKTVWDNESEIRQRIDQAGDDLKAY